MEAITRDNSKLQLLINYITTGLSSVLKISINRHYLDIVNTHDASAVIHVLLQIFFLMGEKERKK